MRPELVSSSILFTVLKVEEKLTNKGQTKLPKLKVQMCVGEMIPVI